MIENLPSALCKVKKTFVGDRRTFFFDEARIPLEKVLSTPLMSKRWHIYKPETEPLTPYGQNPLYVNVCIFLHLVYLSLNRNFCCPLKLVCLVESLSILGVVKYTPAYITCSHNPSLQKFKREILNSKGGRPTCASQKGFCPIVFSPFLSLEICFCFPLHTFFCKWSILNYIPKWTLFLQRKANPNFRGKWCKYSFRTNWLNECLCKTLRVANIEKVAKLSIHLSLWLDCQTDSDLSLACVYQTYNGIYTIHIISSLRPLFVRTHIT